MKLHLELLKIPLRLFMFIYYKQYSYDLELPYILPCLFSMNNSSYI